MSGGESETKFDRRRDVGVTTTGNSCLCFPRPLHFLLGSSVMTLRAGCVPRPLPACCDPHVATSDAAAIVASGKQLVSHRAVADLAQRHTTEHQPLIAAPTFECLPLSSSHRHLMVSKSLESRPWLPRATDLPGPERCVSSHCAKVT